MPLWAATTGGFGLEVFCRLAITHLEATGESMYRAEHNRWTWSKYGGALPGQVNPDALPDRLPPEVQATLQGALIDGFFPVRVPSDTHEFKLAGWAESLRRRDELSKLGKVRLVGTQPSCLERNRLPLVLTPRAHTCPACVTRRTPTSSTRRPSSSGSTRS